MGGGPTSGGPKKAADWVSQAWLTPPPPKIYLPALSHHTTPPLPFPQKNPLFRWRSSEGVDGGSRGWVKPLLAGSQPGGPSPLRMALVEIVRRRGSGSDRKATGQSVLIVHRRGGVGGRGVLHGPPPPNRTFCSERQWSKAFDPTSRAIHNY